MRQYHLLSRRNRAYQVVPVGFSWLAFFTGPIWAVANNVILRFIAFYAAISIPFVLLIALVGDSNSRFGPVIFLAFMVGHIYGSSKANSWVEAHLVARKYERIAVLRGKTAKDALRAWSLAKDVVNHSEDST